jgi:hypothetical protein
MRQDLTATKSFTYAGRALKAGDPFSASRADARTLRALGRAALGGTYQTTEAVSSVTKEVANKEAAASDAASESPVQAAAKSAAANKAAAKKASAKKVARKEADGK